MGNSSGVPPKVGEGWIRIKDAGVAGVTPSPECFFRCAIMAGEFVVEEGLGGGPISDNGSGEIESVSERSRLWGTSSPLEDSICDLVLCASSTNSLTSFGGTKEVSVAFRRPGLTMGDCRTLPVTLLLLLRSFLP